MSNIVAWDFGPVQSFDLKKGIHHRDAENTEILTMRHELHELTQKTGTFYRFRGPAFV